MFMEACQWDPKERALGESDPKILYTKCPMVWFFPCKATDVSTDNCYKCPLYKTADRRGVLMTTGHSTNYVLDVKLPSIQPEAHWIKRGVAMLCALSE